MWILMSISLAVLVFLCITDKDGRPWRHFVKARHGEQRAVWREIHRRNQRRPMIDGRMLGIEALASIGRRKGCRPNSGNGYDE